MFLVEIEISSCLKSLLLLRTGRGLLGGKGGFGAMLRNAGKSGGGQVKNFGACRDLTGRRLRHVNGAL